MIAHVRQAVGVTVIFFVILGICYPLAETAIGQGLLSHQANGSLTANGSSLIGQTWTSPRWFVGRPDSDNPMATGGTNLGPRSKVLVAAVHKQLTGLQREGITPTSDLVTTSGSGVDPDISPADAYAQVATVARARHLPAEAVKNLVTSQIHEPQLGFLGSAYVDVLQLNQALASVR